MSAYFVTGSSTGVGKTFTTCALLHAAAHAGVAAHGCKPVLSGWTADDADSDSAQILRAMPHPATLDAISPWRFAAPLAPHRAAAREGREIDFPALTEWTRAQCRPTGLTLVEGVGGVMVPLTDRDTVLDWIRLLRLPVIFVAGSYLGTLSHTLSALALLAQADIRVAALIVNETAGSTVDLAETQAGFAPFTRAIPLRIAQPRVSSWQHATAIHAALGELAR